VTVGALAEQNNWTGVRRVAGQIEVVVGKPMSYWITSLGETVGLTHCADMGLVIDKQAACGERLTIDFEQIKFS